MTEYACWYTETDGSDGVVTAMDMALAGDPQATTPAPLADVELFTMFRRTWQEDRNVLKDAVVVTRTGPDVLWEVVPRFGTCGTCGATLVKLTPRRALLGAHKADGKDCLGVGRYPRDLQPIQVAR